MNNKKMLDFQTIAVDFDGTLCYSKWPELGQPNQALIEYLQEWKRQWQCIFRKTQRHRTRNGAMPLCLFWHSFLVSAGYLPNTVFLIIKIC